MEAREAFVGQEAMLAQDSVRRETRSRTVDEPQFEAIYRDTARPLWNYIRRVMGNATEADDLLQETYVRFLRKPPDIHDDGALRGFLFRTASNLIVDHWRQVKRERAKIAEAGPPPEGTSEEAVLRHDMARTFEYLKPQDRVLLWLAYVEGTEHREIAATLGLKEKSVRVLLFRARKKLAGLLKGRGLHPGGR